MTSTRGFVSALLVCLVWSEVPSASCILLSSEIRNYFVTITARPHHHNVSDEATRISIIFKSFLFQEEFVNFTSWEDTALTGILIEIKTLQQC